MLTCLSLAGFQSGSKRTSRLPLIRLTLSLSLYTHRSILRYIYGYIHDMLACLSLAGFQSGSKRTSRLPPIRLSPQPPALDESRKQKMPPLGSLNSSTMAVRFLMEHEPSSLQHFQFSYTEEG